MGVAAAVALAAILTLRGAAVRQHPKQHEERRSNIPAFFRPSNPIHFSRLGHCASQLESLRSSPETPEARTQRGTRGRCLTAHVLTPHVIRLVCFLPTYLGTTG